MMRIVASCLVMMLWATGALAASQSSTIQMFIGPEDNEPPSTPVITSVLPQSPTQITVTWAAATDNVLLSGYRVYRDGVSVATTTTTAFIDTGLVASTTYEYTVDAYDWFGNVSTTSDPVATTTLALPPEPEPEPEPTIVTSSGTALAPALMPGTRVDSITTERTATLRWQTQFATTYIVRWGRTTAYELGSVQGAVAQSRHETVLTGLEPGTTYFFQIEAFHALGRPSRVIYEGSFVTQSPPSFREPANVERFTAIPSGFDVSLRWLLTGASADTVVRVVRSPLFYPQYPDEGYLVYEGTARQVLDQAALRDYSPQYYTIFVISSTGEVSSGAVARVTRTDSSPSTPAPDTPTPPGEPLPPLGDLSTPEYALVTVSDVWLRQAGRDRIDLSQTPVLSIQERTIVSISAAALPPHLKTIVVTVFNPSDNHQSTSYLLKLNPAGTAYEAVVPAMGVVGQARLMVEVYDYEATIVRRISNSVRYVDPQPVRWYRGWASVAVGLLTGLGLYYWFVAGWRRRRDEDNH